MANPVSEGIKRLRAQHKLTQTELAAMAKIPRATLANMENDNSNPSISLVMKVAQSLGVSIDDLVTNRPSVYVTEVARKDMQVMHADNGRFTSTRTSPMSTKNLHINDMSMMPECYSKGVPHPEGSHELFLCLEGTATLEIQGEKFRVEAGNLIFFQGHLPHCYGNEGLKPVHGIAVVYMAK